MYKLLSRSILCDLPWLGKVEFSEFYGWLEKNSEEEIGRNNLVLKELVEWVGKHSPLRLPRDDVTNTAVAEREALGFPVKQRGKIRLQNFSSGFYVKK